MKTDDDVKDDIKDEAVAAMLGILVSESIAK